MFLPVVWEEEFVGDILKHLKERRFAPALCYSGFFIKRNVGGGLSLGKEKIGRERERERESERERQREREGLR